MYPDILDTLNKGKANRLKPVSGGSIAAAAIASFPDGSEVFVKQAQGNADMFLKESEGLRVLRETGAIRIPKVLAVGDDAIVLEAIQSVAPKPDFSRDFGRRLARLHQHRGRTAGFWSDNYIGLTPQLNAPLGASWQQAESDDGSAWPAFYMERRLSFQVSLACTNHPGGDVLQSLFTRAEKTMLSILCAATEPASLLHGDLWSGNYLVDDQGEPCLIDPAVHYGHREAELAMTRLFGGFDQEFYSAYTEVSELAEGHEERLPIYQLYHLLNHFNLFGAGYYDQCARILKRYV